MSTGVDGPIIPVPDALRRDIEHCKVQINAVCESYSSRRAALLNESEDLQKTAQGVATEIQDLLPSALRDTDKSGRVAALESRKKALADRLQSVQSELEQLRMPTLGIAIDTLQAILRHWIAEARDVFVAHNRRFASESMLRNAFSLIGPGSISGIRNWSAGLSREEATDRNVSTLLAIFDRALRGQVDLSADHLQEVSA